LAGRFSTRSQLDRHNTKTSRRFSICESLAFTRDLDVIDYWNTSGFVGGALASHDTHRFPSLEYVEALQVFT
jgi:hypothetical protein